MKFLESQIPKHIAIIMDGNGRWATKRGLPRNLGHKAGVDAIKRTVKACLKFNIKYCSFFAFSTENWKRSKEEIEGIFSLVREFLEKESNFFKENNVKVETVGVLDPFPKDLVSTLKQVKKETEGCDRLVLTFALNYGGRDDIVRACNSLIANGKKEITAQDLALELDTKFLPDPDLVIRTSGEQRLSNFMLYQMAYSELYFPKLHWPDFDEKQLKKALKIYQKRDRRYGGIK